MPPVLAADAGGGLVGADHRTGAHRIGNRCRGGQQRRLGAGQDIGDRALTDDQTEHFSQQAGETLEADRLGDVKMDDQRTQSRPERRARLEYLRRRGRDVLPATGTDAAMAVEAGDGRADGRQLDVIVGMDVALIGGAESRSSNVCAVDANLGILPYLCVSHQPYWRQTMAREHVTGAFNKAKGSLKEAVGKVIGSKKLQAEGKADKAKGTIQNVAGNVKDRVRDATK